MLQPRFAVGLALASLLATTVASGYQAKSAPPPPAKAATPAKAAPAKAGAAPAGPVIVIETAKGNVEFETFPAEAPKSVQHVLDLVRARFYQGFRIHWSQPGVIQFGDALSRDMSKKDQWGTGSMSGKPVGVEEPPKRKFERGIVGLFHRADFSPKTADSQIFILRSSNSALDGKYAAIGRVITGMAVVDKLETPDILKSVYIKDEKK